VSDDQGCDNPTCDLHLVNYTRHDPSIIECVADNGKSTRISKVFHVDVFCESSYCAIVSRHMLCYTYVLDPPRLTTNVRTLTGSQSINVFLECNTVGNPLPSIVWLDDNEQEIDDTRFYAIERNHQSSILSFTVFPHSISKVLYYCRTNNTIGTVEKLINISGETT
jgi:hypothetical protein